MPSQKVIDALWPSNGQADEQALRQYVGFDLPKPQPALGFGDLVSRLANGRMAQGIKSGATWAGDVMEGRDSPYNIGRALDMAGLAMTGGMATPAEPGAFAAGMRGYHGSPRTDLTSVMASPPARQFDNGTSQLGAFFAPDEAGAKRYAGEGGRIYPAEFDLSKPYEMPVSEFMRLQDPTKAADGSMVPGERWGTRLEELKAEGAALRAKLAEAGHDGVIIRDSRGNIKEITSFNDVDLALQKNLEAGGS